MNNKTYSREDWMAEAKERFGERPGDWQFKCPACGNVAAPKDFVALGQSKGDAGNNAYQYCIGNFSDEVDCDWKAFGLFRGPAFVEWDGDTVPVFEFAEPEAVTA